MLFENILILLMISIIVVIISYSLIYSKDICIKFSPVKDTDIKYVFWTGGYDSTFRICQLLLSGRKVTPIYIFDIDGEDLFGNKVSRRNTKFEIRSMESIRKKMNDKYPFTVNTFYDTLYIKYVDIDENIKKASKNIYFSKYGMLSPLLNQVNGYYSRPLNQYEKLAQFTKNFDYLVDICIEKTDNGFCKLTQNITIGKLDNRRIIPKGDYRIYRKFRLPIMHLSKTDMKDIAQKDGYVDILKLSWSCWYPIKNKPCGKCDMCVHRISLE